MKLRARLHIDTRRRPQGFAGHGEGRISQRRPERNSLQRGGWGVVLPLGCVSREL